MIWFDKEHPQTVTLKSCTILVGKAPTKAKRLRMPFTLDIGTGDVKGMPEWMQDARDFVMRTGQTVVEKLSVPGVNISMGDTNLFRKKPVEAPKADMRKFVVYQGGDSEEPDTLLSFMVYAPFSTDLLRWCGQMAGEEFTCVFDGVLPQPGDTVVLKAQGTEDEDDDEEDEDDDDEDQEDGPPVRESQSAKAARIRKEAAANVAKAAPQARAPVSFTRPVH